MEKEVARLRMVVAEKERDLSELRFQIAAAEFDQWANRVAFRRLREDVMRATHHLRSDEASKSLEILSRLSSDLEGMP